MPERFRAWLHATGAYMLGVFVIIRLMQWPVYWILIAYAAFVLVLVFLLRDGIIAQIGISKLVYGRHKEAEKIFDRAIARGTKSSRVYLHRAIIYLRGDCAEKALEYLNIALALKPAIMIEKNIFLTMGSCYWKLGDVGRAIEVLENMRTKYEYINSQVLTTLGYMYLLKKDYNRALEFSRLAIDDTPDYASAWDNLGQVQYCMGELDLALASFSKAVELKENLADSHYYLGLIAQARGNPGLARECFLKAGDCPISALNTITRADISQKLCEANEN